MTNTPANQSDLDKQLITEECQKANVEGFRLGAKTVQKVIFDKLSEAKGEGK
jgi:hypothetical protein